MSKASFASNGKYVEFTVSKNMPYTGVYGLQLRISGTTNTSVRVITGDGYWADYKINGCGCWTNKPEINPDRLQDQAIYLNKGTGTIL